MNMTTSQSNIVQSFWQVTVEPLLILDLNGVIRDWNPMANAMLPVEPDANLVEMVRDKDAVRQILDKAVRNGTAGILEPCYIVSPNGASFKARLQLSPIFDADHKICNVLVSVNQKTAALESLEAAARLNDQRVESLRDNLTTVTKELLEKTIQLAEQKNKVATIINSMGEGLVGCDDRGKIIHINQAAQNLLAPDRSSIIGESFDDLFPGISRAIGFIALSVETVEKKIVDINRESRDLRISVSPIFDDEKQRAAGFVVIIQDRTEQAELDRMKSDLISIVSHELRSPLTSIKGYVDLMMTGDLGSIPDAMKDYLSIVSSNANRLAALIDDMLDLSRIETGKLNMSFGKVEIKYLCDYVYLTMKPQAAQKKLNFGVQIEEGLSVSGDQDRLQQALTNLVSNAIKYTPNEGAVTIRARRRNGGIDINVEDNGLGISADNQKKLFQKFFRVKNEKTRNIGGTGLGLCITKSIVEAHDGCIELDSEEGKGSRFTLSLPAYHS